MRKHKRYSKDTQSTEDITMEEEVGGENASMRFLMQNDDIPPGMDHVAAKTSASSSAVSKLGVAASAPPQSYEYVSRERDYSLDEPDIYVPSGAAGCEDSYTEYCPEDAASDFFTSEELKWSTRHIKPSGGGGGGGKDIEQPSAVTCVSGVPIFVPHSDDYDDDGLCGWNAKQRKTCFKITALVLFGTAVILILFLTNIMDPILGKKDESSTKTSSAVESDGQGGVGSSSSSTPVPTIATPSGSSSTSPATTTLPGGESTPTPAVDGSETTTTAAAATTNSPSEQPPTTAATPATSVLGTAAPASSSTTAAPTTTPIATPTTTPIATPTTTPTTTPSTPAPVSAPTTSAPVSAPTTQAPTSLFEEYIASESTLLQGTSANALYGSSISISDDGTVLVVADAKRTIQRYFWNTVTWQKIPSQPWTPPLNTNGTNTLRVTLSGDGKILAVAEPGTVSTYSWNTNNWQSMGLVGTVSTSTSIPVVALSYNGAVLMMGEPQYNQTAGQVRRYQWTQQQWIASTGFTVPAPAAGQQLGSSVSLSIDGKVGVIGSVGGSGTLQLYEYDNVTQTTSTYQAVSGSVANQGLGKQVVYRQETIGTIVMVLSKTGQLDLYRVNTAAKKLQVLQMSSALSKIYNQMALGFDGTRYTALLGYTTCDDLANQPPCLDSTTNSAKTGWMEVWDSATNGVQSWTLTTSQPLLGESLNDQPMRMEISQQQTTLVAGIPGSNALAGLVRIYRKRQFQ